MIIWDIFRFANFEKKGTNQSWLNGGHRKYFLLIFLSESISSCNFFGYYYFLNSYFPDTFFFLSVQKVGRNMTSNSSLWDPFFSDNEVNSHEAFITFHWIRGTLLSVKNSVELNSDIKQCIPLTSIYMTRIALDQLPSFFK